MGAGSWRGIEPKGSSLLEKDRIEKLLGDLSQIPLTRQEKVKEIRRLIREHSYESEKKLEIAISRLLDDISR